MTTAGYTPIDAERMMSIVDNDALAAIAADIRDRLGRVVSAVV